MKRSESNPPTEATLGAFEQIANGVALNQPLILSHNNNFGWWEVEEHLQLLREQGYNVWSEYYPYTCGSSTIGSDDTGRIQIRDGCTGCGVCERVCPTDPPSVVIHPIQEPPA